MNRGHLSYSDRLAIETMLDEGNSIKKIAKDLKRDPSVIIREIARHQYLKFPSVYGGQHPCLKWNVCNVRSTECYLICKNAEFKECPKLVKSPHVCNNCTGKGSCRCIRQYYKAREAHDSYKYQLSEVRIGLRYSEFEFQLLKERLCPLIINTKSIYHAVTTINSVFNTNFNRLTLYKQIERGKLPISSSDLPRCRRKPKKEKDTSYKRDITNHTYEDYEKYKEDNPNAIETQMDTVEGIKENNAPVILTLEIVPINFLFMFKIDSQTKDEVIKKLTYFKDIIGEDTFNKLTEILLTDNGKEFFVLDELTSISPKLNLFYCHPYSSYEKGSIENNHELIRRVIPKYISLKPYSQKELDLLCSHINSLIRESLNGKCPFDLINDYIPIEIINKLGLDKINPLDVCLIPELLGDKNINNIKKYLDKNEIEKANIKFK